jgi:hypothetical protein
MSWLKALADQVFISRKPQLVITQKARKRMAAWFLHDNDIADVFAHGEEVKEQMIVRRYNGYEIGLSYFTDRKTGNAIVTSVWKR